MAIAIAAIITCAFLYHQNQVIQMQISDFGKNFQKAQTANAKTKAVQDFLSEKRPSLSLFRSSASSTGITILKPAGGEIFKAGQDITVAYDLAPELFSAAESLDVSIAIDSIESNGTMRGLDDPIYVKGFPGKNVVKYTLPTTNRNSSYLKEKENNFIAIVQAGVPSSNGSFAYKYEITPRFSIINFIKDLVR